jgi:hypothetical protein
MGWLRPRGFQQAKRNTGIPRSVRNDRYINVQSALRGYGGVEHGIGRLCSRGLLGASLTGYQDANAFDHFGWGGCSLGQEGVGAVGTVEGVDGTRDDHRGQTRAQLFGAADKLVAVHLGHEEVAQEQIDCAGQCLLNDRQSFVRGSSAENVVATCIEQESTDGEDLFVIVDAEDRFSWTQSVLASAGRHRMGGLAADGLKQHGCWLAACRP